MRTYYALIFEYITSLLQSFDQKYIICVNSINLLKNVFYTLSNVFIVELVLTTTTHTIHQLYEYLPELLNQNKRITKKRDVAKHVIYSSVIIFKIKKDK